MGRENEAFEEDLEDSMKDVLAGMQDSEEGVEPEEVIEPEAEIVEPDGPARDENGRFAAKIGSEQVDEVEEGIVVEPEAPEIEPEIEPEVPEIAAELVNPPSSWTAEAKSMWNDVSPRIREEILKRENESRQGKTESVSPYR